MEHTPCSEYKPAVSRCTPTDSCGRVVVDGFASAEEVVALAGIAARGMALGGGAGGPTILDLQSGALSYKDKFIDVWMAFNASGTRAFQRSEVAVYAELVERIRRLAEATFHAEGLHLTAPTFFSRISSDKPPKIPNDQYWHSHVDAEQYGSFVYTSLLYLTDAGKDFEGGAFQFLRGDRSVADVQPAKGRLVLFSSGAEHPHRVTQVTSGTRLALTIAFTCHPEAAIQDFLGRASPDDS